MIEQFLQTVLEFIKEIWFQLDSQFGLENTEAFKFLKPYLTQLQDNPLYMGISLAALFLVPYALVKIMSISKERERKLDELMEEMEEEYDEDDPRRLRRPEPEMDDDEAKPLFENDKDTPPSYMKVLDEMEGKDVDEDDFESEQEEFELESPSSDNEEAIDLEENTETISSQLTENEFEKDRNEFMSDDIDMEKDVELHLDDSEHDQATKELQEDGELMEPDEPLSDNDPFSNYSELDDDEHDQAIKDLQEEMERTINKLTEQIEEPAEPPRSIKDLSQIHIGGDATIDDDYSPETESPDSQSEAPALQEESLSISELSDSETLASLEPENTLDLESMLEPEAEPETKPETESEAIPDTRDYEPESSGFTFEAESDIAEEPESEIADLKLEDDFKLEPEVSSENFSFAPESIALEEIQEPESDAELPPLTDEYASPRNTDSLIDQLIQSTNTMTSPINIIAVGGGKGGIGKSVICTNLAAGMALSGQKVILMDTDFGASNLHALLGISNPEHGFQDFFNDDIIDPKTLLLDTGISNLKFVSGAGDNPGSTNIDTESIGTIISFIKNLEADTILLDLGPGTNYNVIDFFNISTQGVVLTTPEMTSIMKTFSFIRSALFRKISLTFQVYPEIQKMVDHSNPGNANIEAYTTGLLRSKFKEEFPNYTEQLDTLISEFNPSLVVNRVRNRKDLMAGDNLLKLVKKFLGIDVTYLGYIIESDRVRNSIDEMIPFLIKDPQSKPSENLQQIIRALTSTDLQFVKRDGRIFVSKQVRLSSGWES